MAERCNRSVGCEQSRRGRNRGFHSGRRITITVADRGCGEDHAANASRVIGPGASLIAPAHCHAFRVDLCVSTISTHLRSSSEPRAAPSPIASPTPVHQQHHHRGRDIQRAVPAAPRRRGTASRIGRFQTMRHALVLKAIRQAPKPPSAWVALLPILHKALQAAVVVAGDSRRALAS